jgi:hypothetical protein
MRFGMMCLVVVGACASPSVVPTPISTVEIAVTNNRPEDMALLIAGRRTQIAGLASVLVTVNRSALSADGCTSIRVQTIARSEEWTAMPCFGRPRLILAANLASSYIIP